MGAYLTLFLFVDGAYRSHLSLNAFHSHSQCCFAMRFSSSAFIVVLSRSSKFSFVRRYTHWNRVSFPFISIRIRIYVFFPLSVAHKRIFSVCVSTMSVSVSECKNVSFDIPLWKIDLHSSFMQLRNAGYKNKKGKPNTQNNKVIK